MQRILVIEDSTEYRDFIAELLRLCGYTLLEAADGETGARIAHDAHPDLIICDLHLPDCDGFCTLEHVRRDEGPHHIPFLIVSGDTDPRHIHHGLNLGAEAYILKPFAASELVDAVRSYLPSSQLPADLGSAIH